MLRWRTGAAAAWSLILTVPLSLVFMSAVTFSVFDPYSSFYREIPVSLTLSNVQGGSFSLVVMDMHSKQHIL